MALFEKDTHTMLAGVGIGAGAVIALRLVAPVVVAVARPFCKAVMSASMDGFETATHHIAVAAEAFQDLLAETRAERSSTAPRPPSVVSASGSREVN